MCTRNELDHRILCRIYEYFISVHKTLHWFMKFSVCGRCAFVSCPSAVRDISAWQPQLAYHYSCINNNANTADKSTEPTYLRICQIVIIRSVPCSTVFRLFPRRIGIVYLSVRVDLVNVCKPPVY